jgi:hypothetical protein
MDDVSAGSIQLVLHNDDETPLEFVVELLHSIFRKLIADASRITERSTHADAQFAGSSRATLPMNCLKRLENASVPRGTRS